MHERLAVVAIISSLLLSVSVGVTLYAQPHVGSTAKPCVTDSDCRGWAVCVHSGGSPLALGICRDGCRHDDDCAQGARCVSVSPANLRAGRGAIPHAEAWACLPGPLTAARP